MPIDRTIFRKYDIRGKYPAELDEDAAYQVALGYANLFPDIKTVAVGNDARRSSPAIKEAVIKGLIDGGKDVIDLGTLITPVLFFAVCHHCYDGGIVVTASHLGGEYNGIKLILRDAKPTLPRDYEAILKMINDGRLAKAEKTGSLVQKTDTTAEYERYVNSKFSLKHPLKLIIDVGNGTAGLLPERVFSALGCEVKTIYAEPDDSFPHHIADPYHRENMQDLRQQVLETGADLGIGYDGDGDRAGFITSSGRMLTGDELLMMFTRDAFKRKLGPVAYDARASLALIEDVRKFGQTAHLTVSYHAAVLDKIIETDSVFGGETTCHFYFPLDFYKTDDAIVASLKLAGIAAESGDFESYIESLPRYYPSEEIFIPYADTDKYLAVDRFVALAKDKGLKVNDVDGGRIDFENGWGIVRPSNTSPFIKVRFEGKNKEDMTDVAGKMIGMMKETGIVMDDCLKNKIK